VETPRLASTPLSEFLVDRQQAQDTQREPPPDARVTMPISVLPSSDRQPKLSVVAQRQRTTRSASSPATSARWTKRRGRGNRRPSVDGRARRSARESFSWTSDGVRAGLAHPAPITVPGVARGPA